MRDPSAAVYRTKEEVEREKLRDPIALLRDRLTKENLLGEMEWQTIEKEVTEIIEEAVTFAENSPEPPVEWLLTDVYCESGGRRNVSPSRKKPA
jgi:pyruvate dehydrogenase E1 component alpha subunit